MMITNITMTFEIDATVSRIRNNDNEDDKKNIKFILTEENIMDFLLRYSPNKEFYVKDITGKLYKSQLIFGSNNELISVVFLTNDNAVRDLLIAYELLSYQSFMIDITEAFINMRSISKITTLLESLTLKEENSIEVNPDILPDEFEVSTIPDNNSNIDYDFNDEDNSNNSYIPNTDYSESPV